MNIKYCIGKASRKSEMACVRESQFPCNVTNPNYSDREIELRCSIYDTIEEAKRACTEAKEYNPVGFRVLRVVGDALCRNCNGNGSAVPNWVTERAKMGNHPKWGEWDFETCDKCDGKGYIDEQNSQQKS